MFQILNNIEKTDQSYIVQALKKWIKVTIKVWILICFFFG